MSADPETMLGYLAALIGFGGWGHKSINHGHRIKTLESAISEKTKKLDDVAERVENMDGKMDGLVEGVREIREWIMGRAK